MAFARSRKAGKCSIAPFLCSLYPQLGKLCGRCGGILKQLVAVGDPSTVHEGKISLSKRLEVVGGTRGSENWRCASGGCRQSCSWTPSFCWTRASSEHPCRVSQGTSREQYQCITSITLADPIWRNRRAKCCRTRAATLSAPPARNGRRGVGYVLFQICQNGISPSGQ